MCRLIVIKKKKKDERGLFHITCHASHRGSTTGKRRNSSFLVSRVDGSFCYGVLVPPSPHGNRLPALDLSMWSRRQVRSRTRIRKITVILVIVNRHNNRISNFGVRCYLTDFYSIDMCSRK